jgi:hypothetical protein
MPETKNFVFDHRELTEILVKKLDIHEGLWGIYFEFSNAGANIPTASPETFAPAIINFINKVGIQRFDKPSNLTVDAAVVNPKVSAFKRRH